MGKNTSLNPVNKSLLTPRGVTWLGLVTNAVLAAAKILAGMLFFSATILADGMHSASDLVTDAAVLLGLRASGRPADDEHHYGHNRVTTLVAMFVGAALLAAAVWIVYCAVTSLRHPGRNIRGALPFWLAVGSIPVKEILFRLTRRIGRAASNASLLANAWHHRTDAFTSVAAAAGLAGATFAGPSWQFLDPLTAIVLASFLIVIAARIISQNASELIDRAPGEAVLNSIKQAVAQTRGVRSYHAFRARQLGGRVAMDIHIQVDATLTVRQGHDIASAVKQKVMQADPNVVEVIVHVEPASDNESPTG